MKDLNLQASPVMARSNATKPSRILARRDWIASRSLAMTEVTGNAVLSALGGEVQRSC
jgi:hypothetical protein